MGLAVLLMMEISSLSIDPFISGLSKVFVICNGGILMLFDTDPRRYMFIFDPLGELVLPKAPLTLLIEPWMMFIEPLRLLRPSASIFTGTGLQLYG